MMFTSLPPCPGLRATSHESALHAGHGKRAPCDRSDRDRPSSRLTWRRARIDAAFGATAIGLHESVALPRPLPLAQVLERDASLAGWSERARFEARLTG